MNVKSWKLLLIEDLPIYIRVIQSLLQNTGIHLDEAQNLEDGLKKASSNSYDAVLLDLGLPDSRGLDTFRAFHRSCSSIPIIIFSSTDDEAVAIQALQNGAQDYLIKGSYLTEEKGGSMLLTRSIAYAIERHQIQMELLKERSLLEERVSERTQELSQAVDQLKTELEQRRRYEFMVNTSLDPMILFDLEFRYRAVNDAYCRMHRRPRSNIVDAAIADIEGSTTMETVFQPSSRQLLSGENSQFEGWLTYPGLGQRYFDITFSPFHAEAGGEISHFIAVFHDETTRKENEDRIQEINDRLRNLASWLVSAQEDERHRISIELHDEAGQFLTALKLSLTMIESGLDERADPLVSQIKEANQMAETIITRLRTLAHDLRPPSIDAVGLHQTLQDYCRKISRQTGIAITYTGTDLERIANYIQISLYRVIQEALTNVVKHAQASEVEIVFQSDAEFISLSIQDNGRGFTMPEVPTPASMGGIGLLGIQDRIEAIGGSFTIVTRPGRGTQLSIHIPLEESV